ncbi:NAD(P)H-quinone oxidoreductase subunit K, chloroplastic-like [Arachis hypogaea]|uniref:NAD(P)H-quinone oxidoreductase subunit K, chloroplastic-like n=1 Tax=Arachis hypogaea TaxID=3818 RepID=UPI000DEDD546|nr:uncharacterized protein LOC112770624 [Arachis hypogaea]
MGFEPYRLRCGSIRCGSIGGSAGLTIESVGTPDGPVQFYRKIEIRLTAIIPAVEKNRRYPFNRSPSSGVSLNHREIFCDGSKLYWSRLSSLWPLLYGTSCCFIEFASLIGSRFDFDRYGLVPRSSPRQADLILTAGTVTMKMAPSLVRLYEQMPEPKYVIAMGACTITGGMFSTDSYSTVRGVDKLIPRYLSNLL